MALAAHRTRRLVLSAFQGQDLEPLFAFMGDAEAMQHTYTAPSRGHCLARLGAYEAMRPTLGFAPWVVRTQAEHRVIGWGGLSVDPDEPAWGLEVSYAFAPSAWGRGYATELVQYALAHAFAVLAAPEVHAFAKPINERSIRVLTACGFRFLRHEPALARHHYLARPEHPD